MEETKARVDALIVKLGDLSPEVRLDAIKELSSIDKEHALPALHWAIQNELEDHVRNAARDAYQKLSQLAEAPAKEKPAPAAAADKTREMEHPKVKPVMLEEGLPNPLGRISFYIAVTVLILYFSVRFVESGQDPDNIPALFRYSRVAISAMSIPGLGLGILGLVRRGYKHLPAYVGTVVNGIVFLLFFLSVILRVF